MAEPAKEALSPCTLFIRGIPNNCSNETLSEVFSKAGVVKQCFVVKNNKNGDTTSIKPCIGFVTYMTPGEASSALKMEKELMIDNTKLKICMARKKATKKTKQEVDEKGNDAPNAPSITLKASDTKDSTEFTDLYTVQVSGLPALYKKEHVLSLWKKTGLKEPQSLIFPCEEFESDPDSPENAAKDGKDQRNTARFIVDTKQAALKAYNKLSGKVVGKKKNYTLKVIFLTPEGNFKAARKSRLIIRNVSFQCSEDDLKKAFSSYGIVTEVKIPTKSDGKKKGFAFVQFTHVFEASRAIKAMNMQEIKGRKVAIDWSIPKNKYMEVNEADKNDTDKTQNEGEQVPKEHGSDEKDIIVTADDSKEISEDENDSADDIEQSEESDNYDDDELSEGDDESEDEKPSEKVSQQKKKHNPQSSHDIHEKRTVFIQNLSFDETEEGLLEAFSEYGKVCYAKIVMDRETGMSKGCAFVQFDTTDEAVSCIDQLKDEGKGMMLHGKEIRVHEALSRTDVKQLNVQKKKMANEKEDKRNLHLGREGLVRPGTQAAKDLSEIELKKRERIENAKRAKLRNPNVFFSTTRLCVHNLPRSVDDKKLKELLLAQFRTRRGVWITECRIMRDMKNLNEKGVGRPLGYAFVNFSQHEHALNALRSFNNNPDVFGPIKRPIVEFSLENRKALEIKEARRKKFFAKQKLKKELSGSADGGKTEFSDVEGRQQSLKRKSQVTNDSERDEKKPKRSHQMRDLKGNKATVYNKNSSKHENVRLSYQGSVGTTATGKKLPLPTHAKPKIRSKNKGKIIEQMRKSRKLNNRTAQRKLIQQYENRKSGQKQNADIRKRKGREEAEFNDLVAKYSRALSSKLGSKWYDQ